MNYDRPLFYRLMRHAARADRDVVDMVSGSPDWDPPATLRDGLEAYAGADATEFQYPPSPGLTALREEIAARRNVDREQVVVTNGAGEANYLAMALSLARDAGNEVIMTDPVYPYYPGKADLLDAEASFVPIEEDGSLDPDRVRRQASADTACIVVTSPNNPTGAVYAPETVRELVAVAADVDALLLVDEVYDHFDYSGSFRSALETDSDHRIVANSFSKSLAITGFRVGYGIFPPEHVDAVRRRHMLVNVTGSRPAQAAVLRALQETDFEYFARNRERLQARIETFADDLDPVAAEYTTPDGGFYVMARFEGFPGSLENAERLIEDAGVAAMPGETFGEARADWFRFSLCTPRVAEAGERLERFFA